MKRIFATAAALSLLAIGSASQAEAGCVSGAIVGGIAGHFLGRHGGVGAAAGCAYGVARNHHRYRNYNQDRGYGDGSDYRRNSY